jgi:HlyD family secretion protein
MRKLLSIVIALVILGAGAYSYYGYVRKPEAPTIATARVTRGDLAETVSATGALQAVTTVQVGTQVSGTIQELNADFNSIVRKGQVLARLDPSLIQSQIEQARANLIRAEADLERFRVALDDARTKLLRARELSAKKLIAQTELETADVAVRSAEAQLRSQEAGVTQSQASLRQNQVNLAHTVIESPIDGLVISRNVDVGQTVAASMSAPTLFVLAADLTEMQVLASLDESDVGRIRPGQSVRFRVDAFPSEEFRGSVTQVRLQPTTVQNVVTYQTVIDVPNPGLELKPGMTANVNIEIARRTNVLLVPNGALRFRPTPETFAALGQTPPPGGTVGGRGRGAGGGPEATATPAPSPVRATGATTFDALFGPLTQTESFVQVWLAAGGKLQRARLRLGITDGQHTELIQALDGELSEATEVVTNVTTGAVRQTAAPAGTAFPGLGTGRQGFPGGGG